MKQAPSKQVAGSVAEWLGLPVGLIATRYHDGIAIHRASELPETNCQLNAGFIPNPYRARPQTWWIEQARQAVKNSRNSDSN